MNIFAGCPLAFVSCLFLLCAWSPSCTGVRSFRKHFPCFSVQSHLDLWCPSRVRSRRWPASSSSTSNFNSPALNIYLSIQRAVIWIFDVILFASTKPVVDQQLFTCFRFRSQTHFCRVLAILCRQYRYWYQGDGLTRKIERDSMVVSLRTIDINYSCRGFLPDT